MNEGPAAPPSARAPLENAATDATPLGTAAASAEERLSAAPPLSAAEQPARAAGDAISVGAALASHAGSGASPLHFLRNLPLLLVLLFLAFLFVVFIPLPQILLLRWRDPSTTAFIRARQARLRAEGKSDAIDRRPVPLARVSPALVAAVLAAEDARFFGHHGIDWDAVAEARAYNRAHARDRRPRVHGASTITQQLAKNLWLSGGRTWWRKGREAVIALVLDRLVPKRRILEVYLSAIEWGERTYGCEAAARTLFGVPADRLTAGQAAKLAALIASPRWYRAHPDAWERRAALIAARAGRPGSATETDEDEESRAGLERALESAR